MEQQEQGKEQTAASSQNVSPSIHEEGYVRNGTFGEELKLSFVDFGQETAAYLQNWKTHFASIWQSRWEKIKKSDTAQLLLILFICAFLAYSSMLFNNSWVPSFNGDYRMQAIGFLYNGYDDWHTFFATGVFPLWDTSGALGVDNISMAFYYLFDPFFLALLIWPRSWLLQMQSIMMLLKLILAGLFFYKYLDSFGISKSARKIGAVSYAFCGWGWFYLWFFHMQEVITFLPLMLLGIEKIIQKKDPRLFTLGMFLMGVTNYQYFFIFTIFSFFYAMFRFFQTIKTRDRSENWEVLCLGFIAFVVGIMIVAFILVPAYIFIQDFPPRLAISTSVTLSDGTIAWVNVTYKDLLLSSKITFIQKLNLIFKWSGSSDLGLPTFYGTGDSSFRTLFPIETLLFMVNSCFQAPLENAPTYDNAATSLYVSMPILVLLIPSLIQSAKDKKWSHLIAFVLLTVAVETPFMYFLAGGFTMAYGRWELFVSSAIITYVCLNIDKVKKMPRWYFDISLVVLAGLFWYVVKKAYDDVDTYSALESLSVTKNIFGSTIELYKAQIVFTGIWLVFNYLFIRFTSQKKYFRKEMLYMVAADSVIAGCLIVQCWGYTDSKNELLNGADYFSEQTKIVSKLNSWDHDFFRLVNDQQSTYDYNMSMAEGYNGEGAFNSNVQYMDQNFMIWSNLHDNAGNYSNNYIQKRYNFEQIIGVKYYLVRTSDTNVPNGYVDVSTLSDCPSDLKALVDGSKDFKLYRNENWVDSIYPFDTYMSSSDVSSSNYGVKLEANYMKKIIVDSAYLKANPSAFSGLSYNKTMVDSTSTVNASFTTVPISSSALTSKVYSANWDQDALHEENGEYVKDTNRANDVLRTLVPYETDSSYSEAHGDTIEALIKLQGNYSNFAVSTGMKTANGKTLYYRRTSPYSYYYDASGNKIQHTIDTDYYYDASGNKVAYTDYDLCISMGDTVTKNYVAAGLLQNSKVIVSSSSAAPSAILAPEASKRQGAYITINVPNNGKLIDYIMYGYDATSGHYKELVRDFHGSVRSDGRTYDIYGGSNSNHSTERGFYVSEPVYAVVAFIRSASTSYPAGTQFGSFTYQYQDELVADKAKMVNSDAYLSTHTTNVTSHDANTIKFSVNYSAKKAVLINQLYATGWSLKKTYKDASGQTLTEDVPLFQADGGMLGFVSGTGEENYVLSYKTTGLDEGVLISFAGFTFQGAMVVIWYSLDKSRKDYMKFKKAVSLKGL